MQQLLARELAALECRTGSFRLWQQKFQVVLGRKMGLSALLNQDLKLVNVLKAVCSLASHCRVSSRTQDSLPLASSSQYSDDFPAGNLVLNLRCRAVEIVYVVAMMVYMLLSAKLCEVFSQYNT